METAQDTGRTGVFRLGREVVGWCFYDFGAASFSTSVITVFFGPFITAVAESAADGTGMIRPFGLAVHPGAFYPYLISLSVFLQIIMLPLIGALADYTRMKKALLTLSLLGGSCSVIALILLGPADYLIGGLLFVFANLCFGASDVLYNAFLPEICAPGDRNRVSSTGWGFAYFGGGLLLVLQYVFMSFAEGFGMSELEAARLALVSSGVWWLGFGLFALLQLRNRTPARVATREGTLLTAGFRELGQTLRTVRRYPQTLLFLVAFLLYSDGIQTVTSISTQFGQEEVGLSMQDLAQVILIVQFVGVLGAWLFERIARRIGTKRSILLALIVYILITLYAYGPLQSKLDFYLMAAVTALVLVGSQALSRAAFSRMIPPGREAEYFGIYEISERGTSWLSPLFFGLALQFTGSYRIAVLSLAVYFVAGFLLLLRVQFTKAESEAHAPEPPADDPPKADDPPQAKGPPTSDSSPVPDFTPSRS